MVSLLYENYYNFAALFTAIYCFAFINYLSSRVHQSPTSRRFVLFLICIITWAFKDSLGAVLIHYFDKDTFKHITTYFSILYMAISPSAFLILMYAYNAAVPEHKQFRCVNLIQKLMWGIILSIYGISIFFSSFMYNEFWIIGNDYYYSPGPAIIIFFFLTMSAIFVPGICLLAISFRNAKSEAFLFGIGAVLSTIVVIATNVFPGSLGVENLPRFGCISMGLFCVCAFYGIKRYGRAFSIKEIVEENNKLRMIGNSLERLINVHSEDEIYQNICSSARDISNSACVIIISFYDNEAKSVQVRSVAMNDTVNRTLDVTNPLISGKIHFVGNSSIIQTLVAKKESIECEFIHDLFPDSISTKQSRYFNQYANVKQILCYPIKYDHDVKGACILLVQNRIVSIDLFAIFAVQCSLVLTFSSQLRELKEKRKIEDQLQQARKMEAIGQLAGGVAHDFNNMLAGIIGYANLLKRKHGSVLEIKNYTESIISASKRAADLTTRLLTFARKGTYQMRSVDVHVLIGEVMRLLEHTIDKKIRIWRRTNAQKSIIVGDQAQIQNVLLNVALNARDAMLDGGDLVFETSDFKVVENSDECKAYNVKPGDYLRIAIIDNGAGMDENTRSHMFEPFFTTKDVGKGTGLGLASVYGAIKDHEGFIDITSELGKGTTVKISLPSVLNAQIYPELETDEIISGEGSVLLVDDEEVVRNIATEILVDLGYTVHTCKDGVDAVMFFTEHIDDIDIIILDLMMPNKDGYQCFKELRAIDPSIKIIVSTGYNLKPEYDDYLLKESSGIVRKPYECSTLAYAVAKALGLIGEESERVRE